MSDCERVRAHMRVGTECCTKCHAAQELTSFILKNVGEVTVCCTLAAMLHPSDMERPTQPYGLGSGVKPM